MDKSALDIIKEMTCKIKEATPKLTKITEKRYEYSKDECETIFNNIKGSVEEYLAKDKDEDAYEKLVIALSDHFKVSQTGGDISRQVDALSTADELYEKQAEFQEMLDSTKDVTSFIRSKADKIEGVKITSTGSKEEEVKEPDESVSEIPEEIK